MKTKYIAALIASTAFVMVVAVYFLSRQPNPLKVQDACSCLYVLGASKDECQKRIGLSFDVDDANKVVRAQGLSSKLLSQHQGCGEAQPQSD
jgi:hypothetical protein